MSQPVLTREELLFAGELLTWRKKRRMTQQALADLTHFSASRIRHIESGRQKPNEDVTRRLENALRTGGALWARWEAIAATRFISRARLPERNLRTLPFVSWLAAHSGHQFPEIYGAVSAAATRIEAEPPSIRYGRGHGREQVTRSQVATAIEEYYGRAGLLRARVGSSDVGLSVLCEPGWLSIAELGGPDEVVRYEPPGPASVDVDPLTVSAAVERLAAAETSETVMVNNPLYRLLAVDVRDGRVDATVTTVDFAEYALTTDLLGDELVDTLAAGGRAEPLPLRDIHLPDVRTAKAIDQRTCVGGLNALVAIARDDQPGGEPDYVLFVQERSSAVVNLPGALAVIPKAFHQPVGEAAAEALLSTTLRREIEEELLGREDLEQLMPAGRHHVDPMHAQHTTEPLAWLVDRPDTFRTECTGFGLNLVTGSYDFPCLAVIDDPTWWQRFGHVIEMNWETQHVHRYSTLDTAGLAALVNHPRWSNEGLFALLLGLRRLNEVGDARRLALPNIELVP